MVRPFLLLRRRRKRVEEKKREVVREGDCIRTMARLRFEKGNGFEKF
jgi:hypothetical protein